MIVPFAFLLLMYALETSTYVLSNNVSRNTLPGIQAYRSSLTLDWLAAEDIRQRELVEAFESDASSPSTSKTDCIANLRPSAGKVARLMLQLLKNLEGDEGTIVSDLAQALFRRKLLVETSIMDTEPDFEALIEMPGVMMGEPHTTFPRIIAMSWIAVSDPTAIKKLGMCPLKKVTKYLSVRKSKHVAKDMRALEPIIARVRFIVQDFIRNMAPISIYQKRKTQPTIFEAKKISRAKRPSRTTQELYFPTENKPTTFDIMDFNIEDLQQAAGGHFRTNKFLPFLFTFVIMFCFQ